MEQLRELISKKARYLEEEEEERRLRSLESLRQKRYHQYKGVKFYTKELKEAKFRPQETQKILDSFEIILHDFKSGDFLLQRQALYKLRFIIVELDNHRLFLKFAEEGMPYLLTFLSRRDDYVNIAGAQILRRLVILDPKHALEVIHHQGGVAALVKLLGSRHTKVKVEAMRTVAHASFLPKDYANSLTRDGAITELAALIKDLLELPTIFTDNGPKSARKLLRRALEASESLCERSEEIDPSQIIALYPLLRRIILGINPHGLFSSMCANACLTLSHILEKVSAYQVGRDINEELCQRLTLLMQGRNENLIRAAHLIVRNLTSMLPACVQDFIDNDIIPALNHNLTHQSPMCQAATEACKTIYTMIREDRNSITQMLYFDNLMEPLVDIIRDQSMDAKDEAKIEAITVLSTAIIEGDYIQIEFMINKHGCIEFFCDYLHLTKTRAQCMLALGEIIRTGMNQGKVEEYAAAIAQFGGGIMPTLIDDEEEVVKQMASIILSLI